MLRHHSNILPDTTHVWLTALAYLEQYDDIQSWYHQQPCPGRYDVFAWQDDDYLDFCHILAVEASAPNPSLSGITRHHLKDWLALNDAEVHGPAMILIAFEDAASAMLFKLTFGGAN